MSICEAAFCWQCDDGAIGFTAGVAGVVGGSVAAAWQTVTHRHSQGGLRWVLWSL